MIFGSYCISVPRYPIFQAIIQYNSKEGYNRSIVSGCLWKTTVCRIGQYVLVSPAFSTVDRRQINKNPREYHIRPPDGAVLKASFLCYSCALFVNSICTFLTKCSLKKQHRQPNENISVNITFREVRISLYQP